ncbi:S8 family serine peptidase [Nocardiopsis coralliicola]
MRTGSAAAALLAAAAAVQFAVPAPAAASAAADGGGGGLQRDQWALEAIGAADAWDAGGSDEPGTGPGRGAGTTVAVVGTGVDPEHPDLRGDAQAGTDFSGASGDGADGSSTALAGIAAASGHGQEHVGGVLGAAPDAAVLSVRVAPEGGRASEPDALERGIRYAADEGAQVVVVDEGAGAGQELSGVADAVGHAVRTGALVMLPASDPVAEAAGGTDGVVAVAASGPQGGSGAGAGAADLLAPGTGIEAIAPGGGYEQVDGDGPAAALAGGVGALVRAEHPQLLPAQAAAALVDGAEDGVLSAPGSVGVGDSAAEDTPLYDEELVQEDDGLPVPGWVLWTGGAILAVGLIAAGVLVLRRALRDPYDVREERRLKESGDAPEDAAPSGPGQGGAAPEPDRAIGRRRKGAGRRRK